MRRLAVVAVLLLTVFGLLVGQPVYASSDNEPIEAAYAQALNFLYIYYPDEFDPVELTNAAISGMEEKIGTLGFLRYINKTQDIDYFEHFYVELERAHSVSGISKLELEFAAVDAMLKYLDDSHTYFIAPDIAKEIIRNLMGNYDYVGIGVYLRYINNRIYFWEIFPGSPAEQAGIKRFDRLIKVDDIVVDGLDEKSAIGLTERIRGREGTDVRLTILRPGVKDPFEIAVTRRRVTPPAVLGQMIDRNIGYIKLYSFRSDSYYEFRNVLKSLKNNGMTALIIDLRDNPGGLLAELRYFLSTFFSPDTPFLRASYRDSFEIISTSKAEQIEKNIPIVVLINEDSASAAEVAAATFSEYRRAVLVGNRTAGAVEISTYVPLPGHSLMSITIARIRTGKNGVRIEKIGVSPDIYVELNIDDIDIAKDTQLERAIEEAIKLEKIK